MSKTIVPVKGLKCTSHSVAISHAGVIINRGSPPGQACVKTTQALLRLTEAFPSGVPALCPVRQLRVSDMEFVQMRDERESLESTMDCYTCTRCPEFQSHVSTSSCVFLLFFLCLSLSPFLSLLMTNHENNALVQLNHHLSFSLLPLFMYY